MLQNRSFRFVAKVWFGLHIFSVPEGGMVLEEQKTLEMSSNWNCRVWQMVIEFLLKLNTYLNHRLSGHEFEQARGAGWTGKPGVLQSIGLQSRTRLSD